MKFDDLVTTDHAGRRVTLCPRCGQNETAGVIILQLLKSRPPSRPYVAGRSKTLCEPCSIQIFELLEGLFDDETARS